jgi:hypothetical protein
MKIKVLIPCLFLLISLISCKRKPQVIDTTHDPEYPIKINLIKAMTNQKDIKLSDIADSIVYIPLEYVKDNPVGVILDFKYFSNNIFIEVGGSDGGFLRFDGKGKFLNKIGTKGRGPGEYPGGSFFSVIDNPERFYILCNFVPRSLLEFDYNGNFLTKVLTANPSVGKFEAISSDRFLFLSSSDTSFHYMANLKNRSNKSLMIIDYPFFSNPEFKNLQQFRYGGAGSGQYYDRCPLFYDGNSSDTIYSIRNDSIYSRYIIDKGNEGAPFEKLYSLNNPPERYKYLSPFSFMETPHDVFLMAIFKGDYLFLFNYNKASQSVSSMKTPYFVPDIDHIRQPATVYPKFENDIDGGISLSPGKPNREGDVWTYKYDALYFKNQLTKEHFLNSKALYPEKKAALIKLVDSLMDFDNPIIMVVYLKRK